MELLNTTQKFLISENKVPDLSWKNVAIAAGFLVVNGKTKKAIGKIKNSHLFFFYSYYIDGAWFKIRKITFDKFHQMYCSTHNYGNLRSLF